MYERNFLLLIKFHRHYSHRDASAVPRQKNVKLLGCLLVLSHSVKVQLCKLVRAMEFTRLALVQSSDHYFTELLVACTGFFRVLKKFNSHINKLVSDLIIFLRFSQRMSHFTWISSSVGNLWFWWDNFW